VAPAGRGRKQLIFPGLVTPTVGWAATPTEHVGLVLVGRYVFRISVKHGDLASQLSEADSRWYEVFALHAGVRPVCADAVDAATLAVGTATGALLMARLYDSGVVEEAELVEVCRSS